MRPAFLIIVVAAACSFAHAEDVLQRIGVGRPKPKWCAVTQQQESAGIIGGRHPVTGCTRAIASAPRVVTDPETRSGKLYRKPGLSQGHPSRSTGAGVGDSLWLVPPQCMSCSAESEEAAWD